MTCGILSWNFWDIFETEFIWHLMKSGIMWGITAVHYQRKQSPQDCMNVFWNNDLFAWPGTFVSWGLVDTTHTPDITDTVNMSNLNRESKPCDSTSLQASNTLITFKHAQLSTVKKYNWLEHHSAQYSWYSSGMVMLKCATKRHSAMRLWHGWLRQIL